jgi:branched-chain amino acid transport system substrate-binding protein
VSINRKKLGTLLGVLAIGIAVASTAGAAAQTTPGVTSTQITIGGTFPLTGGAALYASIAAAEKAYYGYINAKGGVNGRKIKDIVEDDGYDPSQTFPDVKDLVENKQVFAIVGSLGTAPGLATWGYLNSHQVPQVLLATGDANWGACVNQNLGFCGGSKKPWTMGWQPDYPGEGRLYGKYILAHKTNPHIGVLYQNDAYGKNYLAGFKAGLGSHKGDIVDAESYNFGDDGSVVGAHIGALAAHGANTVVIFATPLASIQAMATIPHIPVWNPSAHPAGVKPLTLLNNVSANRLFMLSAEGHGATPNGVISSTYIESQTAQSNLSGMVLAKKIIHKYAPGGVGSLDSDFNNGDNNLIYGLAVAWTFVDALNQTGANPTRRGLMFALRNLNETKNPFVYPGMTVRSTPTRTFPMQQLILQKWNGKTTHDWKTFGNVLNSGH